MYDVTMQMYVNHNADVWCHNTDVWCHNADVWCHNADVWCHNADVTNDLNNGSNSDPHGSALLTPFKLQFYLTSETNVIKLNLTPLLNSCGSSLKQSDSLTHQSPSQVPSEADVLWKRANKNLQVKIYQFNMPISLAQCYLIKLAKSPCPLQGP